MIDLRKIIGTYNPELPALDPSTPYYEFLSYIECCNSLQIKPSMNRFLAYNRYYNSILQENV
jgi:hypothetical protein